MNGINTLQYASLMRQLAQMQSRIDRVNAILSGSPISGVHISDLTWDKGHGGTLLLGGAANVNGLLQLVDASDVDQVILNKDGMTIYDGKITMHNADGDVSIDEKGIVSTYNFTIANAVSAYTGSVLQTVTTSTNTTDDISGATLSFNLARDVFMLFSGKIVVSIGFDITNHTTVRAGLFMDIDGTDEDVAYQDARKLGSDLASEVGSLNTIPVMFADTLAAGSHTVKLQAYLNRVSGTTTAANLYIYQYFLSYAALGT